MRPTEFIRVLLVEDEAGDAYLVKTALKPNPKHEVNFEITWVESLTLAKQALVDSSFDVMLLDLSLPDSEGLKTIQVAREIVGDLPIIVLTGQGNTDFALTALKLGANDYMVKGDFGFDGLIRVILYTLLRTEMEVENKLLITALNATANGIIITSKDSVIKWANPAFVKLTGYSLQEVIGKKPKELIKSDKQESTFYKDMWSKLSKGESWSGELINKRKDGSLYHEELNISPVKNGAGIVSYFIGIKQDISERKLLETKLQKLANTDPLTGLFNRRAFLDRLEQESNRIVRLGGTSVLLMLDLDFFKHINDTYGHATGDVVLKTFSNIVLKMTRNIDVVARFGGEEFVVLLPGISKYEASIVAERLRQQVAKISIEHPINEVHITVSIGAAILSKNESNGDIILNYADDALYAAKESGRNKICWFEQ